jgi:hypothetical protein
VIRGRSGKDYYALADQWLKSAVEAHRLVSIDPARAAIKEREAADARARLVAAHRSVKV